MSQCRTCKAEIVWGISEKNHRRVPMDPPEKRYVKILKGMLTPEQAAVLPKLPGKPRPFFIQHSSGEAQ